MKALNVVAVFGALAAMYNLWEHGALGHGILLAGCFGILTINYIIHKVNQM